MKNKAKKNNRSISLLLVFLGGFGIFVYVIMRPSELSKAQNELVRCSNIGEVKNCWNRHQGGLSQNEEFLIEIRKKLDNFGLSDTQVVEVWQWLPKPPTHLNIVLVPDLSRRIIQELNNPEQIKNDTILLNTIWRSFVNIVKFKMDSKDRLLVDITDRDQASGNFRQIANDLIFDLSLHKGQSNRIYFDKKGDKFHNNIDSLYKMAKKDPKGADYRLYFERDLNRHILKNTLFDNYRNLLIIITDGYLESDKILYTGSLGLQTQICSEISKGKGINQIFSERYLKIAPCNIDLSNLEILVLEVNEIQSGAGCHFDILRKYWTDWFKAMKVKNNDTDFFIQRNNATDLTKERIEQFIKK
jgi:hypothetical protein